MELETINLDDDPNVQRPTSVNAALPPLEKAQLISLLKEYIDVFAWEYHEMPGLDPNLVAHALNVELRAKPVVQHMRTFHPDVKAQIIQEIQKLLTAGFTSRSCTQSGFQILCRSRKRMGKYDAVLTFKISKKHALKMNFNCPTWICSLIQLLGMLCFHSWMASAAIIRSECHPKM